MANEYDVMNGKMAAEMEKLSLYESFLDDVVYLLKSNQQVDDVNAAENIVNNCIDLYCDKLVGEIKIKPYSIIHKYVLGVMGRDDFLKDLKNFSDPIEVQLEATRICGDIDRVVPEDVKKILSEHKGGYLGILFLLAFVVNLRNTTTIKGFSGALAVYTMISKISLLEIKGYFTSEEYEKFAHKKISGKGSKDDWADHGKETMDVVVEFIKRILDGDKRLHNVIVREVVDEYNAPVLNPIIMELAKKYPGKDIDKDEMKKYKKELDKKTRGKIVSYEKVKGIIYPLAVSLNQANSPTKRSKH